jgi:hypothetical protein
MPTRVLHTWFAGLGCLCLVGWLSGHSAQAQAVAKTYRVVADQRVENGNLIVELSVLKLSGPDFILAASNFALTVTQAYLDVANAQIDQAADGPWDLQANPGHYWNMSGGGQNNRIHLNINSRTDVGSSPSANALVTTTPKLIGRITVPILDPAGENTLQWYLTPLELHDWSRTRIKKTGEFVIASPKIALSEPSPFPVELTRFAANWLDNSYEAAQIDWLVNARPTDKAFELERSSDGSTWQSIYSVEAKTSGGYVRYEYLDAAVGRLNGDRFYYRLKMLETNGKSSFSAIRELNRPVGRGLFKVFPSPVASGEKLQVRLEANTVLAVELLNQWGQVVVRLAGEALKDKTALEIPTDRLAQGVYYVAAHSTIRSETVKIIVGNSAR